MHQLQIGPPSGTPCIAATLAQIAQSALSVYTELVSPSARVTSVKSQQGGVLTDGHPDPKIGPGTPGSDKKEQQKEELHILDKNF